VEYGDAQIWNYWTVTAPGRTDQVASNDSSVGKYFIRPKELSTTLDDVNDMQTRAAFLADKYGNPALRITSMRLDPRADDTQWPRVLGRKLGDKVLVRKRPPGGGTLIEQTSIVEGIAHQFTAPQGWETSWSLSAGPEAGGYWVLDDATLSVLDTTTRLYY
jgi:hypothetical protein